MKKFFAVPLAVLFVAACSDSTAPVTKSSDLTPSYGKKLPPTPPASCTTCPVNDTYTFDGVDVSAAGSTFVTEMQPGITGTASDADVAEAPSGERFLGRFAQTHTQAVLVVPNGYSRISVTYDLYTIGSWDGKGKQAQNGVFQANIVSFGYRCDGDPTIHDIFSTTFSNQLTVQQDYPNAYGLGGFKAASGSYTQEALGYRGHPELSNTPTFRSFADVTYKGLSYTADNPCGPNAAVSFIWGTSNPTQQSMIDESWGIDNVVVKAGT